MKTGRSFLLGGLLATQSILAAADTPHLQSTLVAPDGGSYFGSELGLSGDRAIVGSEAGAYIFVRRQQWEFEQKLTPDLSFSPATRLSKFLIEKDSALITIIDFQPFGIGKAILYERINGVWTPKTELAIPPGVGLGTEHDAAMYGNTIVLTAREGLQLAALVYERQGSDWVLTRKIIPSQLPRQSRISCAINAETLALGVQGLDAAQLARSGVYLYSKVSGSWALRQSLVLDNLSYALGYVLSLDGPRLLLGAPALYTSPREDGLAFVHVFNGTEWVPEQRLQVSGLRQPSIFGSILALHGDTIAVGLPFNSYPGSVLLFERNGGDAQQPWNLDVELGGPDTNSVNPWVWDAFGNAVALNEHTLLIGAPRLGRVYVFPADREPPVIERISATPSVLSPPNHKLRPVTVNVVASDAAGPITCRIIGVSNSEALDRAGPDPDVVITGALQVLLRAERLGSGAGRTYTITVECQDAAGNTSRALTTVRVPR